MCELSQTLSHAIRTSALGFKSDLCHGVLPLNLRVPGLTASEGLGSWACSAGSTDIEG